VSPRAWTLFAVVSVLWGIPYLFISIAVDGDVPPAFLAWARVVLGALVLLPIAWRAGLLDSLRGRWSWIAPYAIAEIVIPFPLIAAGEQHVSSSVAAILIAATPIIVALLAIRFDQSERVGGLRLVGLLVGIAGVAALVGVDIAGEPGELLGAAAILVAAVGYAAGPMMLNRKLVDLDPRATMLGALALAGVLLTPAAAADLPPSTVSTDAIVSIVVLGIVCTAAAFVAFGALVRMIGPGRALVITYVNPVVALIAGILVLDERPGPGTIGGLLLIGAGSYLATGNRLPSREERADARLRSP
jgi:drug/metabolite transporter (DMT)-like permease